MIGKIYDGLQRPLEDIEKKLGPFIWRGATAERLNKRTKWKFVPEKGIRKGKEVQEGEIIGYVEETNLVRHYIMVPQGVRGKLVEIREGNFTVDEEVAEVEESGKRTAIKMSQERPIRIQ